MTNKLAMVENGTWFRSGNGLWTAYGQPPTCRGPPLAVERVSGSCLVFQVMARARFQLSLGKHVFFLWSQGTSTTSFCRFTVVFRIQRSWVKCNVLFLLLCQQLRRIQEVHHLQNLRNRPLSRIHRFYCLPNGVGAQPSAPGSLRKSPPAESRQVTTWWHQLNNERNLFKQILMFVSVLVPK